MSMKRIVHIACLHFMLCCGLADNIAAQQFDWQYSSRLPTEYPQVFLGVQASGMWTLHNAQMRYIEVQNGKECDCEAVFTNATSIDWAGAILSEYWLPELNIALYGALNAEQRSATFSSAGRVLPVNPVLFPMRGDFRTTYTLSTQTLNAGLEAGVKARIPTTPIFASFGLHATTTLTQSRQLRESSTNFPYSAENLPTTFLTFQPLVLGAKATLGADFPLTKSVYASPALFASVPFGSLTLGSDGTWLRLSVGAQCSFLFGIFP